MSEHTRRARPRSAAERFDPSWGAWLRRLHGTAHRMVVQQRRTRNRREEVEAGYDADWRTAVQWFGVSASQRSKRWPFRFG